MEGEREESSSTPRDPLLMMGSKVIEVEYASPLSCAGSGSVQSIESPSLATSRQEDHCDLPHVPDQVVFADTNRDDDYDDVDETQVLKPSRQAGGPRPMDDGRKLSQSKAPPAKVSRPRRTARRTIPTDFYLVRSGDDKQGASLTNKPSTSEAPKTKERQMPRVITPPTTKRCRPPTTTPSVPKPQPRQRRTTARRTAPTELHHRHRNDDEKHLDVLAKKQSSKSEEIQKGRTRKPPRIMSPAAQGQSRQKTSTKERQAKRKLLQRTPPPIAQQQRRGTRGRRSGSSIHIGELSYLPLFVQALASQPPPRPCSSNQPIRLPTSIGCAAQQSSRQAAVDGERPATSTCTAPIPIHTAAKQQHEDGEPRRRTSRRPSIPPDFYHNHIEMKEDAASLAKAVRLSKQAMVSNGQGSSSSIPKGKSMNDASTPRRTRKKMSRRLPLHRWNEEPSFASCCLKTSEEAKSTVVNAKEAKSSIGRFKQAPIVRGQARLQKKTNTPRKTNTRKRPRASLRSGKNGKNQSKSKKRGGRTTKPSTFSSDEPTTAVSSTDNSDECNELADSLVQRDESGCITTLEKSASGSKHNEVPSIQVLFTATATSSARADTGKSEARAHETLTPQAEREEPATIQDCAKTAKGIRVNAAEPDDCCDIQSRNEVECVVLEKAASRSLNTVRPPQQTVFTSDSRIQQSVDFTEAGCTLDRRKGNQTEENRTKRFMRTLEPDLQAVGPRPTRTGLGDRRMELSFDKLSTSVIGPKVAPTRTANHSYNLRNRPEASYRRKEMLAATASNIRTNKVAASPRKAPKKRPKASVKGKDTSKRVGVSDGPGALPGGRVNHFVKPNADSLLSVPTRSSIRMARPRASPPSLRKKKRQNRRIAANHDDGNVDSLLLGHDAGGDSHTRKRKRESENQVSELKQREARTATALVADNLVEPGADRSVVSEMRLTANDREKQGTDDHTMLATSSNDSCVTKSHEDQRESSGNTTDQATGTKTKLCLASSDGGTSLWCDSGVESLSDDCSGAEGSVSDMEWEDGYERVPVLAALKRELVERREQRFEEQSRARGSPDSEKDRDGSGKVFQSNGCDYKDAAEMARELLRHDRIQYLVVDDDEPYDFCGSDIDLAPLPPTMEFG